MYNHEFKTQWTLGDVVKTTELCKYPNMTGKVTGIVYQWMDRGEDIKYIIQFKNINNWTTGEENLVVPKKLEDYM